MPWGGGAGMTATREPFRRRANCVVSSTGEAESPLPWAKYRRKLPVTGGYALLLLGGVSVGKERFDGDAIKFGATFKEG